MKKYFLIIAMLSLIISCHNSKQKVNRTDTAEFSGSETMDLSLPSQAQLAWQDCEVGVIFHFDLPVLAGENIRNNATRKVFDPKLYNPSKLNTDQWIAAARSAGAKYAIFTATHFNGFMQWQSDLYPYGLKQSPWRNGKGDIVGDFVTSCRKAGIKPGIYFSTHRNVYNQVWGHYVNWGEGKGTEKQEAFNRIAEKMTEELCSRYGELIQIWYDAGVKLPHEGGPDVLPIFDKYQPNALFYNSSKRLNHRWIGNEQGHAGNPCWATIPSLERLDSMRNEDMNAWYECLYNGDPEGPVWSPAMVDIVLRGNDNHDWFWFPGQDHTLHTVEELTAMYYTSVGRNCNLIVGVVINPDGLVPEPDVIRLDEFGREINDRFGKSLAETNGEGEMLELKLNPLQKINHVIIMEDIAYGERVREYVIEGSSGDQWFEIVKGISIGHKRIERFEPVKVNKIRFRCLKSTAPPVIRKLSVYRVEG